VGQFDGNFDVTITYNVRIVAHGKAISPQVSAQLGIGLLERIGNTPLVRFKCIGGDLGGAQVLAKAEWVNPGGSIKDRAASNIVLEAMRAGQLGHGQALLDATSGNTGIAYAMLGAYYGFPVVLTMPENATSERKRILKAYGAEVIFTDPEQATDGAIRKAQEMVAEAPHKYFYADQYGNENNWRAHYLGTANEIWKQTEGHITHFVSIMGTSGTFIGTSRRLKELNPKVRCIALQPDSPFHGIDGSKFLATSIQPGIYDPTVADENLGIATKDAYAMVRRLAREEGMMVGISAAAALVGSLSVARGAGPDAVVVTVFPDSADKYLSEKFWDE
jgi:cysteine synthase B